MPNRCMGSCATCGHTCMYGEALPMLGATKLANEENEKMRKQLEDLRRMLEQHEGTRILVADVQAVLG